MIITENFMIDIFEKIAFKTLQLTHYVKKATLTSREIQTAVRLILSGKLAQHAIRKGTEAAVKYNSK